MSLEIARLQLSGSSLHRSLPLGQSRKCMLPEHAGLVVR